MPSFTARRSVVIGKKREEKMKYLAVVAILLFGSLQSLAGTSFGQFACTDENSLRDSLDHYIVVDKNGESMVTCSIVPEEQIEINHHLDQVVVDCVSTVCRVQIVEANYGDLKYWVALGWFDQLDVEVLTDLFDSYNPIVPYGIPCRYWACQYSVSGVAHKGDRLLSPQTQPVVRTMVAEAN